MALFIGALVLVISIGFVVMMAISEWSGDAKSAPSASPLPKASKKKSASRPAKSKAKKKK